MKSAPATRLGDLTEPERQITYGVVKPGPEQDDGVLFVRGGDVLGGRILIDKLRTITPSVSAQYKRTLLRGGELLVSLVGNPGEVAVAPETLAGANIARQVGLVALRPEFNTRFVMYYLMSPLGRADLFVQTGGAVQQVINLADLKRVVVPIPSRYQQDRIADILSAYDDLIENNRRRMALLEDAARHLYREWFVRLRFPGHEHTRITNGVPEGWERKTIRELATVHRGKSYRSSELVETGGRPFANLKCIERLGGFRISGLKNFVGDCKPHHIARPGDILVAVTDLTRDAMIVSRAARLPRLAGDEAVFSMDLVKLVPNESIESEWLYMLLRFSSFADEVKEEASGTTVLHLKPKHIENWIGLVPAKVLRQQSSFIAQRVLEQIDTLEVANARLRAARDLLLPRLMSGEIAV